MFADIAKRLHFPNNLTQAVVWLIDNHMKVRELAQGKMRRSKELDFLSHPCFFDLVALCEADEKASIASDENSNTLPYNSENTQKLRARYEKYLIEVKDRGRLPTLKDIGIDGYWVANLLGIPLDDKRGNPRVGNYIKKLAEQVRTGEITNSAQAEQWLLNQEPEIIEKLKDNPISLYEEKTNISAQELKNRYPNQPIVVTDFQVVGIEHGDKKPWGYVRDGITAIDHHIPDKDFEKFISSTHLATDFVRENGIVDNKSVLVINHTDCDSILASAILRGLLPPNQEFDKAAVAADHTGEKNDIADLLLALMDERNIEFSLRNLSHYLKNHLLNDTEPRAKELLQLRFEERERAKTLVESGIFKQIGSVYYASIPECTDTSLFIPLLPNASVICVAGPMKDNPKFSDIKLRFGLVAPKGLSLKNLSIHEFDPGYGGRWNAGSNKRGGGTTISIQKYAESIDQLVEYWIKENYDSVHDRELSHKI